MFAKSYMAQANIGKEKNSVQALRVCMGLEASSSFATGVTLPA
ncbi:hypothetical protein PAENIP36_73660 [Paenibacillus sp. P36]